jgi:hypothetical protein
MVVRGNAVKLWIADIIPPSDMHRDKWSRVYSVQLILVKLGEPYILKAEIHSQLRPQLFSEIRTLKIAFEMCVIGKVHDFWIIPEFLLGILV